MTLLCDETASVVPFDRQRLAAELRTPQPDTAHFQLCAPVSTGSPRYGLGAPLSVGRRGAFRSPYGPFGIGCRPALVTHTKDAQRLSPGATREQVLIGLEQGLEQGPRPGCRDM